MIEEFFNRMVTLLLARFILNDLPHAAGLLTSSSGSASSSQMPIKYDPLLAQRGEKGAVHIDPETFTPVEILIAPGLSPYEERRVLAHEKLEWREAERAKASGISFSEYVSKRLAGEKGPAHKWIPL
jgi:hypothetical protein